MREARRKKMNKKELAMEMSRRHSMTTGEAKRILELVQAIMEEVLVKGEEIRISGFGIFRIIDRAARTAHNPVTGEAVEVPRRKGITFRPSSSLAGKIKASGERSE